MTAVNGFGSGQAEEATGLVGDFAEVGQSASFTDEIEEIAMLAGRRVRLMFNCT